MKFLYACGITFFVLFLISHNTQGQVNDIYFRQVSPPGGFTLKSIHSIDQDQLGYVWLGTQQGLIRYDSKNTTWFIPSSGDSLSLPDHMINCVQTDSRNMVWIGTDRGLCRFNRKKQNFVPHNYIYEDGTPGRRRIQSVLDDNGNLLVLDEGFVGYLDKAVNTLKRIEPEKILRPTHIYKDNTNRIWIGTLTGQVFLLNSERNKVREIVEAIGSGVNSIYADNDALWVGYEEHGIYKYTVEGRFIKQFFFPDTPNRKTKNIKIRDILVDTYGRLWVGAYEGLFMYDGTKMRRFNPEKNQGLPHTSIFEIYEDSQGAIWIGTWSGGVSMIHHSDNYFDTYRHHQFHNSISNNMISSFLQIGKNDLYIGTEVGGLNTFNLKTEKFRQIPIDDSIDVENIKSMCKDKSGGIWVGTYSQGVWYQPAGKSAFRHFANGPSDGSHITHPHVYAFFAVDSGVWIGTYGKGINFYNNRTDLISYPFQSAEGKKVFSDMHVNCLFVDSEANLWVGGREGVFCIHLPSGELLNFSEYPSIYEGNGIRVYTIWESDSGEIWLGTKNEALLIYNRKLDRFRKFDANGILNGKDVYALIKDENENLWISSNTGLVVHNFATNSTRHFVYGDGIQSNLFTPQAVFKDNNKRLYFGGTYGFTRIDPLKIKTNYRKPLTTIHHVLKKNKEAIYPRHSGNYQVEPVELKSTENTFSISFSADNYLMPDKNHYKYRLKNYYDEWIDNQDGTAFFTGIVAGDYIFEVKACNNDGIWNETPVQMRITVHQFWYKTRLAFILYFLFVTIFIIYIYRSYSEGVKLKRAVLKEKTQRENEEQIHEMKLKFFTNISHEFRTPLTLISWPLQRLLQAENLSKEQKEEIEVVQKNSKRLLQLINQLIDFRKLEKGKSKLNLSRFDLIVFVKEMHKGFVLEDKSKEIDFRLESELSSVFVDADREKLDLLLYNLLSNAYKYSPVKGVISVKINKHTPEKRKVYINQLSFGKLETDDFIEISIEDSGEGIESEDLLNIFNRFEQGKHIKKEKGSGIGLSICKEYTLLHNGVIRAQSTVGEGSCFTVVLPVKQKAQAILFESHQEIKNLKSPESTPVLPKSEQLPENVSQLLIVEDNKDFRNFIYNFLSQYYQVEFAENGEKALEVLKKRNIDLVISDVMMPKMDGFELCSILKTQVETSHIPIILLTALSTSDNLISGLDKGADAYLTKPLDEKILHKQIENILEQRRRLRNTFKQQFVSQKTVEVGSLDNFFLNRVRQVVENNISAENFGMETLAEELMISRSQLHRKIKSLSGTTTSEFVNLVRIKKAVELIESQNISFNEVAYKVGFSSQSYFIKCFRKVYGVSPKVYLSKRSKS